MTNESIGTTWTLARNGERMTCTLIGARAGEYLLRLTHNGHRIIDERCEGPQHALMRSLDAFGTLLALGWMDDGAEN
jgi:hypothetical protein